MFPAPNPAVLAEIGGADAVIYAMGSLYTSICPSLVLQVYGGHELDMVYFGAMVH